MPVTTWVWDLPVQVCRWLLRRPDPPREILTFAVGSTAWTPGPRFTRPLRERSTATAGSSRPQPALVLRERLATA